MSSRYSPWETKQNKMPPHTKILKGNHDKWDFSSSGSFKWWKPFLVLNEFSEMSWSQQKFFGNFEAILALAFRTRDNWFLSSRAKPHPKGRDRKSRCSFTDSSECWLGFYSHYKNCKIKGKLQICCWVFIMELIKTQSKQKLQWKSSSTSQKT